MLARGRNVNKMANVRAPASLEDRLQCAQTQTAAASACDVLGAASDVGAALVDAEELASLRPFPLSSWAGLLPLPAAANAWTQARLGNIWPSGQPTGHSGPLPCGWTQPSNTIKPDLGRVGGRSTSRAWRFGAATPQGRH